MTMKEKPFTTMYLGIIPGHPGGCGLIRPTSDGDYMDTDKPGVSAEAVALLTRELICEQIYRQREKWDAAHPNNALMTRDIKVEEIVEYVHEGILEMNKHELRAHAAAVLDRILAARTFDPKEKLIPMAPLEVEGFRAAGFIYAVNKLLLHPFGFALAISYPKGDDPLAEPLGVIMMKTPSGQHIVFDEEHEAECKQRLEQTLKTGYWDNAATQLIIDNIISFPKKDYHALRDAWLEQNEHHRHLADVATKVEKVLRIVCSTDRLTEQTVSKMGLELANELLTALGRPIVEPG